jgi:hypothetical protein
MLDQTNKDNQTGLPLTVRSVFIVDPNKTVRLILTYPASCGRNFDEILRVVDSLQLTDKNKVTTPANWKPGDDLIVAPSVNNVSFPGNWSIPALLLCAPLLTVLQDQAKELFGEFNQLRPYLRLVKHSQIKQ